MMALIAETPKGVLDINEKENMKYLDDLIIPMWVEYLVATVVGIVFGSLIALFI